MCGGKYVYTTEKKEVIDGLCAECRAKQGYMVSESRDRQRDKQKQ